MKPTRHSVAALTATVFISLAFGVTTPIKSLPEMKIYTDEEATAELNLGSGISWLPGSEVSARTMSNVMNAEAKTAKLKCSLKGNSIYTPFRYFVYNADKCYTKNPGVQFDIPVGKYDICAEYYTGNYDQPYFARVIREDVEITEDSTFELDVEEACYVMFMYSAKEDGSRILLPNSVTPDSPYDAAKMVFYTMATHEDYKFFSYGVGEANGIGAAGSAEQAFGFRVNKVSDKYHFIQSKLIRLKDGSVMYHSPSVKGCTGDIMEMMNKGTSVVELVEDFELTPISRDYRRMQDNFMTQGLSLFKGKDLGGFSATFGGDVCRILCVDNTLEDPETLSQPMVVAGALDIQDVTMTYDDKGNITGQESVQTGVYGCPFIFKNGNAVHINPNNISLENTSVMYPANNYLHGHEYFSFKHADKEEKYSANTPFTLSMLREAPLSNGGTTLTMMMTSVGRWGETRRSDMYQLSGTIRDEVGNILYEGHHCGFQDAVIKAILDGTTSFKLETVNNNIEIDGKAVSSTMELNWDMLESDVVPPVFTMFQTRNSEGKIASRVSKASEGFVEFTAGDFRWDATLGGYAEDGNISVKAEIAAEGADFRELPVEEIEELYHMPAFGHFYRAALADVATTGWHTIRLTVNDSNGNNQIQTLQRAVYIGEHNGIQSVTDNGNVIIAGNLITTAQPTDICICNLNGQVVFNRMTDGTLDLGNELESGFYIVRCGNSRTSAKMIVK